MALFFLSYIAAAAFTLISFLVMTRVLSPEHFGAFNVTVLSATTAYFFILAWVPNSVQRFHSARDFSQRPSSEAYGLGAVVIVLALAAFVVALAVVPSGWHAPMLLGGFFWITHAINEGGLAGLRVMGQGRRFAAAVVLRPLVGTVLAVVLALAGFGYEGAIVGMAAGAALTGVYVMVYAIPRLGIARPRLPALKAFAGFGLPLAFVASSSTVIVLITQSFLAHGPGLAEVGIFAAAQTLALRGITMPMSMLSNAVAASIFHAYETDGDDAATAALDQHFSFLMLVGVPIAGVMALSNDTVTAFLFESPFREEVAHYLPILALSAFLTGVQGGYFDYPFMIARKTALQLLLNLTIVLAHAAVSFGLIWAYGTAGASWAFVFSAVLGIFLYRRLGQRVRAQHIPWVEIRKAALAFLAFAPVAVWADELGHPLLSPLVATLAGFVYVGVLALQRQSATWRVLARFGRTRFALRAVTGMRRLTGSP